MRILLSSWGSRGDLFPFVALGLELQRRGHRVTLVGNPSWRALVEQAGIRFRAAFELDEQETLLLHPELVDNRWLGLPCLFHLIHKAILPVLPETFQVLREEAPQHDLLVAHHFVFAAEWVASVTGIPWVTVCLAPSVTPSRFGRPAGSHAPAPRTAWEQAGVALSWEVGRLVTGAIADRPLNRLRRSFELPTRRDHLFGSRSSKLVLHLFSPTFAPKPADWGVEHLVVGFSRLPLPSDYAPPQELLQFLDRGEPPLVFTLGTTVVAHPGSFYEEAIAALSDGNRRAVLLCGKRERLPERLPPHLLALDYCAHDWLFPRAAAVFHQCGSGTSAAVLHAGVPSVACPRAFDQPNNAARLVDLGTAILMRPKEQNARGFRLALEQLDSPALRERCREVAHQLAQEDGAREAAKALEALGIGM